jgi:2-dehydro-3-deoxyphosphogluconate aldolase/(4S)-4-hydroxy-2-oxoglutarate aldolase
MKMRKIEVLNRIIQEKLIAIIRAESAEQGLELVRAIKAGGISIIEVTMTVPGAMEIIGDLKNSYKNDDIVIGAGTVLDPETARECILRGADFIVSPSLNLDTIKLVNRYGVLVIPGIMTIREALDALEAGVLVLKLFPANVFGPSIIKTYKDPLPQADFIPTGGVNVDNVREWISAGAIAVGVGSALTKEARKGDYGKVTETAKEFLDLVRNVKKPTYKQ